MYCNCTVVYCCIYCTVIDCYCYYLLFVDVCTVMYCYLLLLLLSGVCCWLYCNVLLPVVTAVMLLSVMLKLRIIYWCHCQQCNTSEEDVKNAAYSPLPLQRDDASQGNLLTISFWQNCKCFKLGLLLHIIYAIVLCQHDK